jgi:hypothetical protein
VGGIPVVSDILETIRWGIDTFISNVPRPIQIGFFLLLLLVGANLISMTFHVFGIHCNTNKEVVKTDFMEVSNNFKIMYITGTDALFGSNKSLESANKIISIIQDPDDACYLIMKQVGSEYVICPNITDTACKYYYKEDTCANCSTTADVGWVYSDKALLNYIYAGDVCSSDAYYDPDVSRFRRLVSCEPSCQIPAYYKFNFDTGKLDCTDIDRCGINGSQITYELDRLLEESDATLYYQPSDEDINSFIGFKCSNDYNPRVALFKKLDIFDFKIWLLLIVLGVMITSLHHIRDWIK